MAAQSISPADLLARIDRGDAPAILDVRTPAEFAGGHVPGAVNMPFQAIRKRIAEVPGRPDEDLVVYCGHGPRAYLAAASIRRLRPGRRIVFLQGHWTAWRRAGLRVG
jgi:rhodanese-related sulfurtransferase